MKRHKITRVGGQKTKEWKIFINSTIVVKSRNEIKINTRCKK